MSLPLGRDPTGCEPFGPRSHKRRYGFPLPLSSFQGASPSLRRPGPSQRGATSTLAPKPRQVFFRPDFQRHTCGRHVSTIALAMAMMLSGRLSGLPEGALVALCVLGGFGDRGSRREAGFSPVFSSRQDLSDSFFQPWERGRPGSRRRRDRRKRIRPAASARQACVAGFGAYKPRASSQIQEGADSLGPEGRRCYRKQAWTSLL